MAAVLLIARSGEDLRRVLGISFASVELHWDDGFEAFLRERKRRRRVLTEGALKYCRNLFKKYLEAT